MKLHEELTAIQNELQTAETRWTELQEQLESP
jgi:predicted nuclease with TOPRIM domain